MTLRVISKMFFLDIIPPEFVVIVFMIKKADLILAAILIIMGLAVSYYLSFGTVAGNTLEITSQGRVFGIYSLYENRTVVIETPAGHFNKVRIQDGCAFVTDADCPGKDCINSHRISKCGETILCLPNKLVLKIKGGKSVYDSISK
ncbi:MAG: NusG domain II-containing protein [Firmicutes bacterium]|nr:NusG domain II-containing protein [Bacillota bacterium]MDY6173667.1 NusG domain II-containing protein [Lentihominibacter sp.]